MLTLRERQLFDDLERRFYATDPHPAGPDDAGPDDAGPDEAGGSSRAWVLEVAMGICVAMVAICGLHGSPEGVVCFTGTMMILAFMHYTF